MTRNSSEAEVTFKFVCLFVFFQSIKLKKTRARNILKKIGGFL